jgi:hypothetical protein
MVGKRSSIVIYNTIAARGPFAANFADLIFCGGTVQARPRASSSIEALCIGASSAALIAAVGSLIAVAQRASRI